MFVSVFACPCCGTVIQPANPVEVGRQVQCFACRTTFVVPEKSEDVAPKEPPAAAPLPSGYPLQATEQVWLKKREPDYHPPRGQFRRKRLRPNFGLIAFLIAGGIALILVVLLGGVLAYRQLRQVGPLLILARPNSNRERLIGVWETVGSWKKWTLDFRRNGELFITIDNPRDEPHHEEEHGTWEILSESGEKLTVRLKALNSKGETHDETKEFTFDGKNVFWESGQKFHRLGSK